jgi:hypothetical protein
VPDHAGDFQLFGRLYSRKLIFENAKSRLVSYLNVESGIEAHFEISLRVFIEHTKETLFEDGGGEAVERTA